MIKQIFMLLILTVGLASCGGSTENSARENDQVKDHVELIFNDFCC